jgi:AraC family transcriptional regulator, positive regulator of tynA and feaB
MTRSDDDEVDDLPEWVDLIRERFVALDIRPADEPALRGRVSSHPVGPLTVASVRSVGQTFRRTARLIDRYGEDLLQVGLVRRGAIGLDQDGRSARVPPGSFVVYDTTRPFTWTMSGRWHMDVFTWRREDVLVDDRQLPAVTARPVAGGASGLVARAALTQIAAVGEPVEGSEGVQLAGRIADLVLTAVTHLTPDTAPPGVLLRDVLDLIELRLGDPRLCPESIASECHVSLRSLHRLFADQPRSLARWIRYRRLERARTELLAFPDRPVAAVAARGCFTDATVFARAFRDEYGMTPSDVRRASAGARSRTPGTDRTAGGPAGD